ncbi:MAG: permease-like cell division protein FtsX [Oscillospiraceae bacterium]|nr:permease-like cell division protein FtsX [Candidatus Limimonas coprohippi]
MSSKTKSRTSFNLGYLTKEGVQNVWSNRLMSLASVAVLTSCLVLIGVAVMLFVNIDAMLENVEDQNVIMVYLNDGLSEEQINKAGQDIRMVPNVDVAEFVSKDEAYAEQLEAMGEDALLLEGLEENPMPDSYRVTLSDLSDYDNALKMFATVENVLSVRGNSDLAGQVREVRSGVTYICLGIIVLLLAVSLFIIANTVRVTMYNRRLEINIMKAVGATNWFIRWPFIIEGIVIGIFSGFVSLGLVFALYKLAMNSFGTIFSLFGTTNISFLPYALPMLGSFILIGVTAGVFGSIVSMSRYLKEHGGSVVSNDNDNQ